MKLIAVLIGCLIALQVHAKTEGYIIEGELKGAPDKEWVFLTDLYQTVCYDSAQLNNGHFELKGKVETPELRYVVFFKSPARQRGGWRNILSIPVYLENSKISLSVPFEEMPSKLTKQMPAALQIKGSASHDLYRVYRKSIEPLSLKYDEAFEEYSDAYYYRGGTDEDILRYVRAMDSIRDLIYHRGVDFIREHGKSPVALYVAGNLAVDRYGRAEAQRVAGLFPAKARVGETGKQIEKALLGKPLYVGDPMPDVLILDTAMQKKNLSELVKKGRYTLIELWASWCSPCRGELPYLKGTYRRYHDKGFDIVSVSIDDDMASWKNAVAEEKMPWVQTCGAEGKGHSKVCMQAFGADGVPSCFLVGPDGRIVHLNARAGWLNLKLAEIFGCVK